MESVHITLDNNTIIRDVIRLVNEGMRVTLPVKGNSMLPFIIGNVESVELVKPQHVAVGDVVLAWINGTHYVVHRVISVDGSEVRLMGDGNLGGDERCTLEDVAARAEYVVDKKGQKHYLYTPWRVRASRLWWKIKPVRRWILAIYRRTVLKMKV